MEIQGHARPQLNPGVGRLYWDIGYFEQLAKINITLEKTNYGTRKNEQTFEKSFDYSNRGTLVLGIIFSRKIGTYNVMLSCYHLL